MTLTSCPDCGAVAEILRRATLESTSGPVEHVQLRCVRRHWFFLPTFQLERSWAWPPAHLAHLADLPDAA
jgi:hypothetical protein